MREAQKVKQNSMEQMCFRRRKVNKNVCGESPIKHWGLVFCSDSFLSTPPHLLNNSFCSDPLKNCVVVHELHKKEANNCLYLPGLLRSRTIIGRDQWNNIKVII